MRFKLPFAGKSNRPAVAAATAPADPVLVLDRQVTPKPETEMPPVIGAAPEWPTPDQGYFHNQPLREAWDQARPPSENVSGHLKGLREADIETALFAFLADGFSHAGLNPMNRQRSLFAERVGDGGGSSLRGVMKWSHPDVLAAELPWRGNTEESRAALSALGAFRGAPARLHAFEVKRELECGKVWEKFFQALRNSTWAHYSWLVFAEITQPDERDPEANVREVTRELERMSRRFGIGLIKIDCTSVTRDGASAGASRILFPATPRPDIDVEALEILIAENARVRSFFARLDKRLGGEDAPFELVA